MLSRTSPGRSSQLKVSVQRLSSGFRVNSAADDAAGLGRADQLRSHSRMIQASIRNINDGVSALEVADKAAEQITDIVTRMGELAASAAQGTLDPAGRSYYSDEYDKLIQEIDRIAQHHRVRRLQALERHDRGPHDVHRLQEQRQRPALLFRCTRCLQAAGRVRLTHLRRWSLRRPYPTLRTRYHLAVGFSFTVGGGPVNSVFLGVGATLNNLVSDINSSGAGVTASVDGIPGGLQHQAGKRHTRHRQ